MPTVLRKYGFRFHFYSQEPDEPPHIHVEKEGCRAKVWLNSVEFAKHGGFKAPDQKRILEIVADHRQLMIEAWHEYF